jgi:hypothetical protein
MNKHYLLLTLFSCIATLFMQGCSGMEDTERMEDRKSLSIQVSNASIQTKALIEGNYLPDNSKVSVSLMEEGNATYDGITYRNISYTAKGIGTSQKWEAASQILLSSTIGKVYAYYPYSASVTSITSIPVETSSQTDYMYATPVSVSDKDNNASLVMNHALSAIRFSLVKGTYTGAGKITAVSVKGTGVATGAVLNAQTGLISNFTGANTAISIAKNFTLSNVPQEVDAIIIPTGTNAAMTLSITMDGKEYTVETDPVKPIKGTVYKYKLTINSTGLTVDGITAGDWEYNEKGEYTIDLGHKIIIKGDLTDIAIATNVANNTLTLKAVPVIYGKQVNEVNKSGTATVSQAVDGVSGMRTITVSNVQSDVTLTFNGTGYEVAYDGNQIGLTINKVVNPDGSVTITATPPDASSVVKPVTGSGTGNLTQTLDKTTGKRTITIRNLGSKYTVTFDGWYKLSYAGTTTGITIGSPTDEANGSIKLIATPTVSSTMVKDVSGSGTGTLSQTVDKNTGVRTITITGINGAYIINFNGCEKIDPWEDVNSDGIYYVASDGSKASSASSSCIGIVLVANGHKLMIEKNEDSNQSYKTAASGKSSTYAFYWGGYGTDQTGITNYDKVDGSNGYGYLKPESGSYNGTPNLSANVTAWTSGALSDWKGKANSNVLKGVTTGGGSYTSYATIGHVLKTFLASADAKGYDDWYIPSCGQLSLIYMHLTSVNNALSAIGGQQFNTSSHYWSSSEYSSSRGWSVYFNYGRVDGSNKNYYCRVRFVRDI